MNSTTIIFLSLSIIILVLLLLTNFKFELKFTKQTKEEKSKILESKLDKLSNTELKILKPLSEGKSNKEIANDFSISLFTVKKHVSNTFKKLGISTRAETRRFKNLIKKEQ